MIRITSVYLACAALLALAACGKHETPESTTAAASTAEQVPVHSLTAYDGPVVNLPREGNCALDVVNGAPASTATVEVGHDVIFGGWASNGQGQVPDDARLVLVSPSGSYAIPVAGGVERPDVARALSQPGLRKAGFNVGTTLTFPPGTYDAFIVYGGASPAACALNIALMVVEQAAGQSEQIASP